MTSQPLQTLTALRSEFSRDATRRKAAALRTLMASPPADGVQVRTLHGALLFIAAYPDDAAIRRLAQGCLRSVCRSITRSTLLSRRLSNTGILGTTTTHEFSLAMLKWLSSTFPGDLDLDWSDETAIDRLEALLPHLVRSYLRDGLYADHLSTREWMDLARGQQTAVAYLVDLVRSMSGSFELKEQTFESMELAFRWRLNQPSGSRTFARFPSRAAYFQQEPILKKVELRSLMDRRLPPAVRLNRAATEKLLDACRITLCTRNREIDTLTYVNPREIYFHQLERGIDVAVFGMSPHSRLPIESYFGFVAARNRVPVAYGGGWVLFDRCEIGVNIFDEFRGGESAFTFAQVLRVYRQLFKSTRFYVDPFQFGADNSEAIRSGAFWFYYRLGFRPADARLQRLAAEESQRITTQRGYRSPPAVLRRFAKGKLLLDLNPSAQDGMTSGAIAKHVLRDDAPVDLDLTALSLATTKWIGDRSEGEKPEKLERHCANVWRILGIRSTRGWPGFEGVWFGRLVPLLWPIDAEMRCWPLNVRRAIAAAFRAKGGTKERVYVRRLAALPHLREAWLRLAATAPKSDRPSARRK